MQLITLITVFAMTCTSHADVTQDTFGWLRDEVTGAQVEVRRYTLTSSGGAMAQVIDYGATLTTLLVPDRHGQLTDINMGFDDLDGYINNTVNPYFGAIVGRVANRIGGASFVLKGRQYNITKNNGNNQLHGGFRGFDKRVWSSHVEDDKVTFSYLSADGEEGYPGQLFSHVTYWLSHHNELHVDMIATSSKPTPINLVNHAYFNLAGHDTGSTELINHIVSINANSITPTSTDLIPTGEIRSVNGTIFDLRTPRVLKDVLSLTPAGDGYDINFCVNQEATHQLNIVARVVHPGSGRVLEVYSDQPGVQFYTSNSLPTMDILKGKGGYYYKKHGAFCLETQNYPDAINKANFPSSLLLPGRIYNHKIVFRFSVMHSID